MKTLSRTTLLALAALTLAGCKSPRVATEPMTNRPLWVDTLKTEIRSGSDRTSWERKVNNYRNHLEWDVPWPRPRGGR